MEPMRPRVHTQYTWRLPEGAGRAGRLFQDTMSKTSLLNFMKLTGHESDKTPSAMHYVSDKSVEAAEEAPRPVQRPKDKEQLMSSGSL